MSVVVVVVMVVVRSSSGSSSGSDVPNLFILQDNIQSMSGELHSPAVTFSDFSSGTSSRSIEVRRKVGRRLSLVERSPPHLSSSPEVRQ